MIHTNLHLISATFFPFSGLVDTFHLEIHTADNLARTLETLSHATLVQVRLELRNSNF